MTVLSTTGKCAVYIMHARLAYSATVMTESQHSLVYRSINRMRCFSWQYFVHLNFFIYVTMPLTVECCTCGCCTEFLISPLWHVWDHINVLLLEGDIPIINDIISMFFVCRLGSSSDGCLYKCFRRLYFRLLRIFPVIITFCIQVMLLGIRKLFS
jgi:hypothetical protein